MIHPSLSGTDCSINSVVQSLIDAIKHIHSWCHANLMALNILKQKSCIFQAGLNNTLFISLTQIYVIIIPLLALVQMKNNFLE